MASILLAGPGNYRWQSYCERLQGAGHEVVHVVNGIACVRRLRQMNPRLLVLEPAIPWGGGDGVLDVMDAESRFGSTRVIILTAGCDAALLYRLSQFSVDDLLRQPLSASQLQQRIQQLLSHTGEVIRAVNEQAIQH